MFALNMTCPSSNNPPILTPAQSGPDIIVEVDIVMDEHATLRHTHDVSQVLQDKLETLPGVERAYVHVDYESTHTPVSTALSFVVVEADNCTQEHRKEK